MMLLTYAAPAAAQVIYSCDFENATENANWTLNKIATNANLASWKNIWRMGAPGNCANGAKGLYICTHNDTANVGASSNTTDFIVAYREGITVPTANTTYRLSFDWRANGKAADGLYVYWIPDSYTRNTNSATGTGSAPAALESYKITTLRGTGIWKSYSTTFTAPTTAGKLLFLWYQNSGSAINPPAAVDNIEIASNTTCAVPTNFKYNPSGSLSWSGSASSYDVRYCNTHDNNWTTDSTTATSYTLTGITEGTYTFQVRANCGGGVHSQWVSISQFIWIAGLRCIDFFDYGASLTNLGKCYVGNHASSSSHSTLSFEATPRVVDYGSSSNASMHTIHTEVGEIDPNTSVNGGLPTIPAGEIASIRLGAYTSSGDDARIEYKYKVQNGMSDLLDLSYACVLQSGRHNADNPFFQLDILDQRGQQIDGCTHAYFVADQSGTAGSGWHQEGDIFWCDWRTVTVSLTRFVGQTLTIRLTSSRCVYDTHFGYAYFTLNCRSGGLQGIACGDFSTDHFTAPGGFDYKWYKQSDPNTIVGTDSVLGISVSDTAIYKVDVISKLNDGCYYTLVANPNPRFPETNVTPMPQAVSCQNIVRFRNKSGVVYINRLDSSKTVSEGEIEDMTWDFGDGTPAIHTTDSLVEHIFPQKGGTYNVKVSTSMSGDVCVDEQTITLRLPELGDKRVETVIPYCYDGSTPYNYNGKRYYQSFKDSSVVHLPTGCDSTDVLTVNFVQRVTSELYDTICGEVNNYTYAGNVYSKGGDYPVHFTSALGCDSLVTLHLYKHPVPAITVDSSFTACADEASGVAIPYSLTDVDATVDSIHVYMGDEAIAGGFAASYAFAAGDLLQITWPADIAPNVYQGQVVFSSPWCTSYTYPFRIELYYPSSTLDQKNGIVACLNEEENGGYHFLSYQWYRNGERMEGETASYVRVSDEEDMNAEYYVVVLRAEDNVVLRSCPITYTGGGWRDALNHIQGEAAAVKVIQNGVLYIIRDGVTYTTLGTIVSKHEE